MRVRLALIVILAAATTIPSADGTSNRQVKKPAIEPTAGTCETELELAKTFVDLGDWQDAETHFTAASKEAGCRQQGLAGIQAARGHQEANLLQTGQIYESEGQWSKAEDLYRAAAGDQSIGITTRKVIGDRLRFVLEAQVRQKRWTESEEKIKDGAGIAVFLLAMFLLIATIRSIWKSRRIILIHPFAAPTDELAKGLDIQLRYARVTMNNPAFSPAAQMPPFLVENLKFSDEVEPVEDLEIAGSKIPFASLGRLFGRPSVRVTGGFDGIGPIGNAYSIVQTYDASADAFIRHEIRVGVPNEQRLDLLDFAYDVIVKASSAYAAV